MCVIVYGVVVFVWWCLRVVCGGGCGDFGVYGEATSGDGCGVG